MLHQYHFLLTAVQIFLCSPEADFLSCNPLKGVCPQAQLLPMFCRTALPYENLREGLSPPTSISLAYGHPHPSTHAGTNSAYTSSNTRFTFEALPPPGTDARSWAGPISHLVMGVRHSQEVVKALVDGQEGAINAHTKVPLANHGCRIALDLQDLCNSDLRQRQASPGVWVKHTRVNPGAHLEPACQQGCPAEEIREAGDSRDTWHSTVHAPHCSATHTSSHSGPLTPSDPEPRLPAFTAAAASHLPQGRALGPLAAAAPPGLPRRRGFTACPCSTAGRRRAPPRCLPPARGSSSTGTGCTLGRCCRSW